MNVEDLLLKQCVWFKSQSIVENNAQYLKCHGFIGCQGYDPSCPYYMRKVEYFKAKLAACQKLNGEKKI